MPTAVVTGANSGIGNAFAQILCNEGYKVHAVDKDLGEPIKALSGNVEVHQLDVTNPTSIDSFKTAVEGSTIDLLLNIAGIMFPPDADTLTSTTLPTLSKTFSVNTFGPLLLTQALLPNILASSKPKIGLVSSRVGSIADNSSGGSYAYRASKAALNSIGKSMAMDLKQKGVLVVMLHPGYVNSNLNQGGAMPKETVQPEEAAEKLWRNVVNNDQKIGMEQTGTFWHREGFELPW